MFEKMTALATKQTERMANSDIEAFLVLSSKRELIQKEISWYEREFGKLMNDIPAEGFEETRSITEKINDAVKTIQEIDLKNEKVILLQGNDLLSEIKALRQGRKALKGYGAKTPGSPQFIDRRS